MIRAGIVKQPVQIACVGMTPVEVQKETQTQLLWFAQVDRNSLFQASEIPSFYHIDRQGNPEWTRDISHLEV